MLKTAGILAVALGLTAGAAHAQSCSANSAAGCSVNTTAQVTVPAMIELTVGGAGTINLTSPVVSDLTTGYVQDNGPTIGVKANRRWTLSVHTTAVAEWVYSGTENGVKPISDLTWSNVVGGTYAAITTSAAPIVTNEARTNSGSPTIFFRTLYSSDFSSDRNAAGTYSIPLVFTLTAP